MQKNNILYVIIGLVVVGIVVVLINMGGQATTPVVVEN